MTQLLITIPGQVSPTDIGHLEDAIAHSVQSVVAADAEITRMIDTIALSELERVVAVCALDLVLGVGTALTDESVATVRALRARLRDTL